ncbi:4-fold beta flower protein [Aquimarina macrocephali]|uniref:4-fold beta flower protein n=1 Tax=Aquimarina macrocephali TaxID=666563 RepID=UPI000465DBF2|nr:hypothetical protein [Aquimarina macrocephali]
MKVPIYKWSGNYWGFIYNNRVFNKDAKYKGWVDDENRAWNSDGKYIGEIVSENYILRRNSKMQPMDKIPKIPPIPPIPKIDRIGKINKMGWTDVLDKL